MREVVVLGREAWMVTVWAAGYLVLMKGDGSESGDTGQGQTTVV